jgi:phosphoribosylformylglycinamidine synthase subunit PurQ / glutaminase
VAPVKVLILRAAGINCDLEAQHAWELAGAQAERVHVRRLIERPDMLAEYQVLMIPGGFSYGDDIAAGRILAAQLKRHLIAEVRDFVASGRLVLGVCNGFQVLVNAGLLPFGEDGAGTPQPQVANHVGQSCGGRSSNGVRGCTISYNDPPGFQDRWVNLRATGKNCAFLEPGREYEMPIAHGEGRVLFADDEVLHRVLAGGLNALAYVPSPPRAGVTPGAPFNPNGSVADIAGLCDPTGRILGLMPHPERFVSWTQHPCWTTEYARAGEGIGTSTGASGEGDGLALFRRAVAYLKG